MAKTGRPPNELHRSWSNHNRPVLTAPKHLPAPAKRIWRQVQTENPHLRHKHYSEAIESFVLAVHRQRELQAIVDREGYLAAGSQGQMVAHPAVGMLGTATSAVARLSSQLGLVPSSRKDHVAKEEEKLPEAQTTGKRFAGLKLA